ncbi:MAG: sigma-70 family RNA polymerase sigma factor [Fimbriimonas ginsengisoli]|uniref:Sigma-70 family RNA polymerase sigma factor n=1 Tax=Fimbriimonas ginsengisoli TaxID=1005039 RepID=A0A931LZA7_FIMGI|nr:sigma-70 family RNA polymerase sigma factor [Fimbriimonas ginsengisoli]MBI3722121.1 sigma-70 family RNA polymerase sigma factor [Fimbriimonas ginsengisoli]
MINESIRLDARNEVRFSVLMNGAYRKVFNMAYRLAGNRPDAEDLTQEAFYRAYRSFNDFEGDRPFENWILRIVTRLFLDMLRSRKRRVKTVSYDAPIPREGDDSLRFDVPDSQRNPEQRAVDASFGEDLQLVLDSLTPQQRLLITLADIQGVPYKEIAEILHRPVGTIRSRLHRTHKVLRARLEVVRREIAQPLRAPRPALGMSG